jgi:hypothetical protein
MSADRECLRIGKHVFEASSSKKNLDSQPRTEGIRVMPLSNFEAKLKRTVGCLYRAGTVSGGFHRVSKGRERRGRRVHTLVPLGYAKRIGHEAVKRDSKSALRIPQGRTPGLHS